MNMVIVFGYYPFHIENLGHGNTVYICDVMNMNMVNCSILIEPDCLPLLFTEYFEFCLTLKLIECYVNLILTEQWTFGYILMDNRNGNLSCCSINNDFFVKKCLPRCSRRSFQYG